MLYTPNIVPGMGFIKFCICKKRTKLASTGRPQTEKYDVTDKEIYGILSVTSPDEQEQWRQNGHPVTHNIVQHTAIDKAAATDILLTEDGRCFYVQYSNNPGGLNVTMIYKVEERNDMYECIEYLSGDEEVDNQSNSTERC